MTFKTQAEIFQALLDGKTLLTGGGKIEMKLIDNFLKARLVGELYWNDSSLSFSIPEHWSIKKEPMVIYGAITEDGGLAGFNEDKEDILAHTKAWGIKCHIVKFIEVEEE